MVIHPSHQLIQVYPFFLKFHTASYLPYFPNAIKNDCYGDQAHLRSPIYLMQPHLSQMRYRPDLVCFIQLGGELIPQGPSYIRLHHEVVQGLHLRSIAADTSRYQRNASFLYIAIYRDSSFIHLPYKGVDSILSIYYLIFYYIMGTTFKLSVMYQV